VREYLSHIFGNVICDLTPINGSILVKILGRNVIYRNLQGTDLCDFRIGYIFNTVDHVCFEKLPFVDEFFDTFRIGFRAIREALIITSLARGTRPRAFWFMLLLHAAAKSTSSTKGGFLVLAERRGRTGQQTRSQC
jgi:hypothetical protein